MIDFWNILTTEEVEREIAANNVGSLLFRFKRVFHNNR